MTILQTNMLVRILGGLFVCSFLFWSTPAFAIEPLDTFYTQQIYLSQIGANRAWNEVRESPDVVIAVLDTGVDIDHPDLKNNIWYNDKEIPNNGLDDDKNGFVDDVNGWDFISDTPNPRPKFIDGYIDIAINHGTLVSGVIAAEGGNDIGVAGLTWKAQIMPLRVLDSEGVGDTVTVSRAINYARENGADIINLSFVGDEPSVTLNLAIERAYKSGILVVAAAGNELANGIDMDISPRYPVCQSGPEDENWVFGVAAVDLHDRLASFSNYGASCIDITAPGVRVFTTQVHEPSHDGFAVPYGSKAGTSLAAPQVSGAAALIKAINPSISLSELQRILSENATRIEHLNQPYAGQLGAGRLNVFAAVDTASTFVSPSGGSQVITAAGPGGGPHVRLFDVAQKIKLQFFAYDSEFAGGIHAQGVDVDEDTVTEIIATPRGGMKPEVRIFSSRAQLERSFLAYDEQSRFGIRAHVADVDGDGRNDIVTAPEAPGGPHVRVFNDTGKLKSEFFAFNKFHRGGISIALADIDGDDVAEIITAPQSNALPVVRVFDFQGNKKFEFFAYDPSHISGMNIAAWEGGIVVGSGHGSKPEVRVFSTEGEERSRWMAYTPAFKGGVYVSVADINNDFVPDIITGPGNGGGPHLRIFDSFGKLITQWMAYNPGFRGGISVGVSEN